jgi:hypothetical protein
MDDLKTLPFWQHLSVLNNLFGTSKGMNGSFTPALNQGECSTVNASFTVSYRRVSIHQLSPFWTPLC